MFILLILRLSNINHELHAKFDNTFQIAYIIYIADINFKNLFKDKFAKSDKYALIPKY